MGRCEFCGRYREYEAEPHSNHETCPYAGNHELLQENHIYPDDTLLSAIENTEPGHSVSLRGWCRSYPLFRTVVETRTWVPSDSASTPVERGLEAPTPSYWKKTIWTTGNKGDLYRIEYDPTSPSLIEWYELTDDSERKQETPFETYMRVESADVSFFGSTLPG